MGGSKRVFFLSISHSYSRYIIYDNHYSYLPHMRYTGRICVLVFISLNWRTLPFKKVDMQLSCL